MKWPKKFLSVMAISTISIVLLILAVLVFLFFAWLVENPIAFLIFAFVGILVAGAFEPQSADSDSCDPAM